MQAATHVHRYLSIDQTIFQETAPSSLQGMYTCGDGWGGGGGGEREGGGGSGACTILMSSYLYL